jgi:2-hydroxychromene-2-carboxylate isomerase
VRFYFSFRSPYSWLAERLIEDRYAGLQDECEYIPYWEPDAETARRLAEKKATFLYRAMSREKHLYILKDIKRQVAKFGYRVTWPIDRAPWWERPHLAYLVAARQGVAAEFRRRVYQARFEEGRDVCDAAVIGDIAGRIGIDPAELLAAPGDSQLRDLGAEGLRRADRDGIFGVPFMAVGHERFWGVDRLPDLVEAVHGQTAVAG